MRRKISMLIDLLVIIIYMYQKELLRYYVFKNISIVLLSMYLYKMRDKLLMCHQIEVYKN